MSYQEQLRDPRWQKKRLEIMERDEWTCQTCGDTEATLTVHHKSYRQVDNKFVDVWDYDGEALVTLCEHCHSVEEHNLEGIKKYGYLALRANCDSGSVINELIKTLHQHRKNKNRLSMEDVVNIQGVLSGEYNEVV